MNLTHVHPTAFIHPTAQLGEGVVVGPWCLIDAHAQIADGVILESRIHVYAHTQIGARTHVFDGAILGAEPQDLKYQGEASLLKIGSDCRIREYCTLNRGTKATGETVIGDQSLLMAYVHVAHDCHLGTGVVLANQVQLGGHVRIGDFATLGGNAAVQQFTRIGAYSFVGGTLKIERDLPPASKALGNPVRWAGLNLHALRRHGFSTERIATLERQYHALFQAGRTLSEAVQELLHSEPDPLLQEFFCYWKEGLVVPVGKFV